MVLKNFNKSMLWIGDLNIFLKIKNKFLVSVSVCLGCHKKYHTQGNLSNRDLFYQNSGARNLRLRCHNG